MNEIDRDINEEYVNFKLKLEISKMVTVDKIFTKKWLFVVDEVLFLRTMKSIKEKKLKYHGFHTINDTEKIQIKKWMMKYMTTYVNPTNHPLINNEEIVNKFIHMINNKDNYVNYDKTNIRVEGYSSPLNSKLMDMKDTFFCTLFKDTDQQFGSIGPFTWKKIVKYQHLNWSINPPYIEKILKIMYMNVIKAFEYITRKDFLLIILIPKWEDNEIYINLKENKSGLVIHTFSPAIGQHYMNCNGRTVMMQGVVNSMFFLSRNKTLVNNDQIDKLIKIWSTYENDFFNQSNFTYPFILLK